MGKDKKEGSVVEPSEYQEGYQKGFKKGRLLQHKADVEWLRRNMSQYDPGLGLSNRWQLYRQDWQKFKEMMNEEEAPT